jgi:hypothetical protein
MRIKSFALAAWLILSLFASLNSSFLAVEIPDYITKKEVISMDYDLMIKLDSLCSMKVKEFAESFENPEDFDLIVILTKNEEPILPDYEKVRELDDPPKGSITFIRFLGWDDNEWLEVDWELSRLYDVEKSFYGDPSPGDKYVFVKKNPELEFSGVYHSGTNILELQYWKELPYEDRVNVLAHEMVHAFRDDWVCQWDQFEEGHARAGEYIAMSKLAEQYGVPYSDWSDLHHKNSIHENWNRQGVGTNGKDFLDEKVMKEQLGGYRYSVSGYCWWKVFEKDKDFFIKFNSDLYQGAAHWYRNFSYYRDKANDNYDGGPIEGYLSFLGWFNAQPIFKVNYPVEHHPEIYLSVGTERRVSFRAYERDFRDWPVSHHYEDPLDVTMFYKAWLASGERVVSSDTWISNGRGNAIINEIPDGYKGRFKVEAYYNHSGSKIWDEEIGYRGDIPENGIIGVVGTERDGIIQIDGPVSTTLDVNNGAFCTESGVTYPAGEYTLCYTELYRGNTEVLKIVKDEGTYFVCIPRPRINRIPPAQPFGISGTVSNNTIYFSWLPYPQKEVDFEGYRVYRKIDFADYQKRTPVTIQEFYYEEELPPAYNYVIYRATSIDKSGNESGFSDPFVVCGPKILEAVGISETEIKLRWQYPEHPQTFVIRWSEDQNYWHWIEVPGENREFIHSGLERGAAYYYTIHAMYYEETSPLSEEVSATTNMLNPATELEGEAISYSQIALIWKDHTIWNNLSETQEGWIIEYWREGETHNQLILADDNDEEWVPGGPYGGYDLDECLITDLTGGMRHFFQIYARDADGNCSNPSEELFVRLGGVGNLSATSLNHGIFLQWWPPPVPFSTKCLIVRGSGSEVAWQPTDGIEYQMGHIPGQKDTIVSIGDANTGHFEDDGRRNSVEYYYDIYAFIDGDFEYTRPARSIMEVPTGFSLSGSGCATFDLGQNNSKKLISTALDSICLVYSIDDFVDAQTTEHLYCSKHYDSDWNTPFLIRPHPCGGNGVSIASTEAGTPCIPFIYYNDLWYTTLVTFNGYRIWYDWKLMDDGQLGPDYYLYHPAIETKGEMVYISCVEVNEDGGDCIWFLSFNNPGLSGLSVIDSQQVNITPAFKMHSSSIAICEDNGIEYVHFAWKTHGESYEKGSIYHRYGRIENGVIVQWFDEVTVRAGNSCHPCMIAGEGNTAYLIWNERNVEDDSLYMSYFNGTSWSDPEDVYDLPELGPNYRQRFFPTIVYDSGSIIAAWEMGISQTTYNAFYSERNSSGEWTDPINIWPLELDFVTPRIALSNDKSELFIMGKRNDKYLDFKSIDLLPIVSVQSPNSEDEWECGSEEHIIWEAKDNTEGLIVEAIEYSINGGTSWITIATEEENDGDYLWTVPNTLSENCIVRITVRDHANNVVWRESGVFTISDNAAPEVTLISPNGGEYFNIGDTENIRWQAMDNVGISSQHLYYSINGEGGPWEEIEIEGAIQQPNGEYFYSWEIPVIFSHECRIKVETYDFAGNRGEDISDYNFIIWDYEAPEVTILEPDGGEEWEIKTTHTIKWQATDNVNVTNQNLYYSTNYGEDWIDLSHGPIGQEPGGNYSCEWITPEVYSSHCLVKVECSDGAGNSGDDESDNVFTISDFTPPNVSIIRPNGGENIEVGSEYVIAWDAVDNGTIEDHLLWYSTNAGVDWMEIPLAHPPQQGSYIYPWDVPGNPSMKCMLKARSYDAAENFGEDVSDGLFRISWYVSSNTDATGYSPKVVKAGNKLHLVYTSSDSIFYAQSADDGETFERKYFIGLGAYPTIISNGDANLYILWTNGEQLFYRRFDGVEWQSSVLLGTISSVTELRQVIGCIDDEGRIQMGFEGMYRMGRGIESNIAFHGIMARNDPNTFEYDAIAINEKPEESATISFDLDMYGTAYLIFSYNGEVYCYSNERGYWAGKFPVGEGRNGYIDSYDGYVHVVWEDNGVIKHRHRLIRSASWFSTETVSSDISKYYRHPIFDKGCVAVYTEIPQMQPDHISNIVYRIRDRGIWQKQEYLTEGLNADYPQLFIEDYRDYNAKLYAAYTEATFALSSIEIIKKEVTIPHQTSDILQATAYNFQDKMALDSDSVIHIVYQDKVNIMYTYSEDGGEIFSEDVILGEGRAPVITLLPNDEIGVLWTSNGGEKRVIFRKGIKEEWGPPFHIFKSIDHFALLPVNFTVDNAGSAYVSLEMEELLTGGYAWRLYYGSFDTDNPEFIPPGDWILIDEYEVSYPPPPPPSPMPPSPASSDICFANDLLHLVWSRPDGMVLYSNSVDGSHWTPKYEVSHHLELSYHPSIDMFENRLGCVWQAGAAPEVYYSFTDSYEKWSNPLKISKTKANSYCPVLAENAFIVWSEENEEGLSDLIMSRFDRAFWTNQQITESESYASYPHDIINGYPKAWLGILYTEGTEYPFNVTYKPEQVDIPWWTSNTREATASNSQHKLVIDENGLLHLVFESDGHILYTTSTDAEKWALEHYLGEGVSPAIGLDSDGKPSCVWVNKPASANDPLSCFSNTWTHRSKFQ